MKHLLLGTTALVAAGFMVGEAYAADPIKLGIGGFARGAGGVVLGDDDSTGEPGDNTTTGRFRWDAEVHFKGESTLDNGITVGARIELEGQNAGDQIDEAWVDFSGGFGEVRFGQFNEAALQMCVGDPGNVTGNFGANSPNNSFTNEGGSALAIPVTSLGTCYGVVGDDLNLTYFSPSFGGFQFAVSYQPNTPDQDTGPGAGTFPKGAPAQRDIFSAGATFNQDFDAISLLVGGGASFVGHDDTDNKEASFYQAGVQVGFGGFTVGAAGSVGNNYQDMFFGGVATPPVAINSDYWTAQVGGNYTFEAWSVGLEWTHGEFEVASSSDEDTFEHISLNGSYAMGPGINLEAQGSYVDYDDDSTSISDYSAFQIGTGFAITF